jgi:hypothetical protein
MVMVHPDDGDEELADCVTDDGWPEFEQSIEAGSMWRAQVHGENCNNDCKKKHLRRHSGVLCSESPRSSFLFLADAGLRGGGLDAPIGPEQ